jgi:hypothetical protein
MIFPSAWQLCLEFPKPPEIGSSFFPCRRWRLLDPQALSPPVKPGKSRQIVASETADLGASDQARTSQMSRMLRDELVNVRFSENRAPRARGVAHAEQYEIRRAKERPVPEEHRTGRGEPGFRGGTK